LDFICIWERVDEKQTDIVVSKTLSEKVGILEKILNDNNFDTKKKC
jgi:hypothetical protein